MPASIRLSNSQARDGLVQTVVPAREPEAALGLPGHAVAFRRYLACTEQTRAEVLSRTLGDDYAQALIDGDPEGDLEHVGRSIGDTNVVYLSASGEFLHSPPALVEVITAADGTERERRTPVDVESNVGETQLVRWTGRKFPVADAVRKFVFRRTLQVTHVDGLTYDFLFGMARELGTENALMLVGAGPKGTDPLIFQANGRPCRAFLGGRVDGERYQLLMHLSDMELKQPAPREG